MASSRAAIGLTESGTGTQILAGANTYSGPTIINSGSLTAGANNALSSASSVTLANSAGAVLNLNGHSATIASFARRRFPRWQCDPGQLNGILTVGNASNTTYSGSISGSGTSGLVKQGTGTLTLTTNETYTGATTVSAGSLQTGTLLPGVLAHRWSFNNSLADSVGGSTAVLYGDATDGANQVTSTGNGSSHVNYVSLGTNILPTANSPATIELWVTENQIESWSRIFDFGSTAGGVSNLFWSFTFGTSNPSQVDNNYPAQGFDAAGTLTVGTEYHMALVITPSGNNAIVTWYQMDLAGNVIGTASTTVNGWNISDINQVNMWLGRSEYGDNDANASWDEVRIWDTALSQAQLVALDVAGPDATFVSSNILPTTTAVSIASGATLDLDGDSQQIASLSNFGGSGGSVINSATGSLTLTVNSAAGTSTFSGAIGGGGGAISFAESGTGTQVLAGANTWTGTTTVTGGVLDFGGNTFTTTNTVSFQGGVTQDGTIIDNSATAYDAEAGTVSASLQGSAGLTKTTSGSFTLSSTTSSTFTGPTIISSGSLTTGATDALSSVSSVTLANTAGVTLNLNGYSQVIASLAGGGVFGGNVTLGANAILTFGNASNTTYSGSISGSGTSGLVKQGAGTLSLNAAETYTGGTTVSAGTLQTASVPLPGVLAHRWSFNNSLADSVGGSTATLFGDATVGANSVTSAGNGSSHVNYVSLGTNLLPTTDSPATIELWVTENQAENYSRILDFGGTNGGPTDLFWSFTNGTSAPSEVGADFGATGFDPVGALTVGTEYHLSLVFTPSGANEIITSYQMDLAGNVLNTNSVTIPNWNISDLNQVNEWLGRSEYNPPDQDANASWDEVRIWDTALTQAQLVTLDVEGPDASFATSNVLPTTTAVSIASGATLDLAGNSQQIASLSNSGGGGGSVINSATGSLNLTVNSAAGTSTFSGVIGGGNGAISLTETGTGTQVLAGANTFTGGTTINGGTLKLGSASSLPTGGPVTTITGGTLDLGGFTVANTFSFQGGVTQDGAIMNNGAAYDAEAGTVSASLQGSAGLTVATSGSFTLSSSTISTYAGPTVINSGSLNTGATNALSSVSSVTLANTAGVTLNLNGFSQVIASLTGGGALGGNVTLGANAILTVGDANNTTFSGTISGTGTFGLIKQGTGTLTLTAAETYTGATTVSAGTLQTGAPLPGVLAHRWSFNNSLADSVGGSTAVVYGDASVGANSVTSTGNGSSHVNYISLGSNLLPSTNAPTTIELWVTENQAESWSRVFDFGSGTGGVSNLYWSFTKGTSSPGQIAANATTNGVTFAPGVEYHVAVVLTPDGSNTDITFYQFDTAGTLISSGTLDSNWNLTQLVQTNMWLGRSEFADNDANATWDEVRIWDTALTEPQLANLGVAGPDAFYVASNILPTTTALSIASGATLDLDGTNQQIASLSNSGGSGGSVINSYNVPVTLTVNSTAGTSTFSGAIGGGGGGAISFTETGTGTQVLSGTNTYTGGTTVSGGTLDVGTASSLPTTGPITVTGGTLDLGGFTFTTTNAVSFQGGITQDGTLVNNGAAYDAEAGTVSASLQGSAGLSKTTSGTFTLSSTTSSTNGGPTTIDSGSLTMGATNALPAATSVSLANTAGTVLNLAGYSQTIGSLLGGGTIGGNVTLGANAILTVGDATNTIYSRNDKRFGHRWPDQARHRNADTDVARNL